MKYYKSAMPNMCVKIDDKRKANFDEKGYYKTDDKTEIEVLSRAMHVQAIAKPSGVSDVDSDALLRENEGLKASNKSLKAENKTLKKAADPKTLKALEKTTKQITDLQKQVDDLIADKTALEAENAGLKDQLDEIPKAEKVTDSDTDDTKTE